MIHLPALGCQPEPDRCWDRNVVQVHNSYTTAAASWEPTGLPNGYWDGSGNSDLQSVPSNNYWVNWLWPTGPQDGGIDKQLSLAIYLAARSLGDKSRMYCAMPVQLANLDIAD